MEEERSPACATKDWKFHKLVARKPGFACCTVLCLQRINYNESLQNDERAPEA